MASFFPYFSVVESLMGKASQAEARIGNTEILCLIGENLSGYID
jgi:hypothetical protein